MATINIALTNSLGDDLFKYQILKNAKETNGSFDEGKTIYDIYTHDTSFNINVSTNQTIHLEELNDDDNNVSTSTITNGLTTSITYSRFKFVIGSYTIKIIRVPLIEIKKMESDTDNVIDFNRVGFKTDNEFDFINNRMWYIRLYNEHNFDLNYKLEYFSYGVKELETSEIYNDSLLINSAENDILFKFIDVSNTDISFNIAFKKSLKNILIKNNADDLNFPFDNEDKEYTFALPSLDTIN